MCSVSDYQGGVLYDSFFVKILDDFQKFIKTAPGNQAIFRGSWSWGPLKKGTGSPTLVNDVFLPFYDQQLDYWLSHRVSLLYNMPYLSDTVYN